MKTISGFTHHWVLDNPFHFVDVRDWFYMVNAGAIGGTIHLHVRVLGVRSLWTFHFITYSASNQEWDDIHDSHRDLVDAVVHSIASKVIRK